MNIQDVYSAITFRIGTPDDTSGRAANPQVTNKVLLFELLTQLRSYANITKGIQDFYSFPLNRNTSFVPAPPLALRSRSYFYAYVVVNGAIFPIDFRNARDVYPNFRINPMNGITNWFMPFSMGKSTYFGVYPTSSTSAQTTTLTAGISAAATTIPVVSTAGYINNFGKITLGTEKIMYEYKDATNFYGCIRGDELTTAASALISATVTQNNVILLYSRLPVPFAAESDGSISANTLAMILEPPDEHMEGIIKMVSYNLLSKINTERAQQYKGDAILLYGEYEEDIRKGYARNRQNVNVRDPYFNETGAPIMNFNG